MGCFDGTKLLVGLLSACLAVNLARADCIWYDECGCNTDLDPGWCYTQLYPNRRAGPILCFYKFLFKWEGFLPFVLAAIQLNTLNYKCKFFLCFKFTFLRNTKKSW